MNPFLGVFFHWLGGFASGSFYVPYRFVKKWAGKTCWLVEGSFFKIILPSLLALILGVMFSAEDVCALNQVNSPLSPAHQASQALSPDPFYKAETNSPETMPLSNPVAWIYGHAQLEAWKIDQLVKDGFAGHKRIGYSRDYGKVIPSLRFRHSWPSGSLSHFSMRAEGEATVTSGGNVLFKGSCHGVPVVIQLPETPAPFIEIALSTLAGGEPVTFAIVDGPLRSGQGWDYSRDGVSWAPADFVQGDVSGLPPHASKEPVMMMHPKSVQGQVYDFGCLLQGSPVFRAEGTPSIVPGESVEEALAPTDPKDVDFKLERRADGLWTFPHTIGLRYLRVQGDHVSDVGMEASVHPVCYRGAFACSDEKLTRMWLDAAYTLRLCMNELVLDGVKRDRMPWIGDLAAVIAPDAYAFGDPEILRRTFTALGHPFRGAVNGIADYSLWLVIGHALYQLYFDDMAYLQRELPCLNRFMDNLASHTDTEGLLHPEGGVFIDWGYGNAKVHFSSALQILWYWAQVSLSGLNAKAGDPMLAQRWQKSADALAQVLQKKSWLPGAGAFSDDLDKAESKTSYPNFLAVLSGFAKEEQRQALLAELTKNPSSGTPFMKAYELQALTKLGSPDLAMTRIRQYWGGMMDAGAVTFWENYRPDEKDHTSMYGRPFARSLCHGWSSGPVALLPQAILGVEPLSDGWKEFKVVPHLGDLSWAKATIPTPLGVIEISTDVHETKVLIPRGLTLISGSKRFTGPMEAILPVANLSHGH